MSCGVKMLLEHFTLSLFSSIAPIRDYYRDFPFREIMRWFTSAAGKKRAYYAFKIFNYIQKTHWVHLVLAWAQPQGERKAEGARQTGSGGGRERGRCLEGWFGFTHRTQMPRPVENRHFSARGSPRGGFNHLSYYTAEKHQRTNCSEPAESPASISRLLMRKDRYVYFDTV